jgi:hypothetical protein
MVNMGQGHFFTITTTGDQDYLDQTRRLHDEKLNNYLKYGAINGMAWDNVGLSKLASNLKPISIGGILPESKKLECKSQSTSICMGRDFQQYIIITTLYCEEESEEEEKEERN